MTIGLALFGYVLLLSVAAWRGGQAALFPAWISVLAIAFAATLVHELGHAIAAMVCGHRIIVFAVRPLAWQVHNGQIIFMSRGYEAGLGGFVMSAPRELASVTLWRRRFIVAGGPMASAALAAVALFFGAPSLHAPPAQWGHTDAGLLAFGLGLWSGWFAIVSLLPYGAPEHRSDGEQLWAMRRGLDVGRYMLGVLGGYSKYAVRLRDWPSWLLNEIIVAPPALDNFDMAVEQWDIGRMLDAETVDAAETRRMLDVFRRRHGDSEWLASCDAYFTAIWEDDWRRAELKLWGGGSTLNDRALRSAAEAAVAARRGDQQATARHLADMRSEIAKRSPFLDLTFRDIARRVEAVLTETRVARSMPVA